ncbi:MAG: serine/threonine-protein kinase [Pseudonocardiaceae bacterium]
MLDLLDHRYLVRERLGAGTFGQVHRAEHRVLGMTLRDVAVKLFTVDPRSGEGVEKLLSEALHAIRMVDRCPDPVVRDRFVACYDAALGERPYIVMELVAGDVAWKLDGAQLPVPTSREYLRQLCQGMAFMHRQGVVHLDLKPSNVLVSDAGPLKIADFGCSARIEELIGRHSAQGTLIYQPAEVLAMSECGPAADVYALGLIGYEMLTGRLPDQERLLAAAGNAQRPADHAELIRLKLKPVPRPSDYHPALDGHPLEAVVLRALSPLATDRYPDAGGLLRAVEEATDDSAAAESVPPGPARVHTMIEHIQRAVARPDLELAAQLADEAAELNRGLPDEIIVIELYPVLVRVALRRDDRPAARRLAHEGLRRRPCQATYRAMAMAFAGTDTGKGFDRLCREVGRI